MELTQTNGSNNKMLIDMEQFPVCYQTADLAPQAAIDDQGGDECATRPPLATVKPREPSDGSAVGEVAGDTLACACVCVRRVQILMVLRCLRQ